LVNTFLWKKVRKRAPRIESDY